MLVCLYVSLIKPLVQTVTADPELKVRVKIVWLDFAATCSHTHVSAVL